MCKKDMGSRRTQGSLDTNVLLRFVLDDVPEQTKAIDTLFKKGGVYCVEDVVLVEMVFVLEKVYALPRDAVVDSLLVIINHRQIVCAQRIFEQVLPLYRTKPSLSFLDCLVLVYARFAQKTPLYTFDKALVKHSEGNAKAV
jgi:predicted nucleic-acid-binding protein